MISAHSPEVLGKRRLDFRVIHRFSKISGGYHAFFGLDNMQDVRIGLEYGITGNFMAGIARTKGAPNSFQGVSELYELLMKYNFLTRTSDNSPPVTASLVGNTVYSAMKRIAIPGEEGNFQNPGQRFSYSLQGIAGRKFGKSFSLQIMPVYVRRNWARGSNKKDLFSLGGAGKVQLSNTLGIASEYFYVFSPYRQNQSGIYNYHLALALEINTGGHVFAINFTNTAGTIANEFLPYSTNTWLNGNFRFGFFISRKFNL